jgi:hypothetical protein
MLNEIDKSYAKQSQVCVPTRATLREWMLERKKATEEHLADVNQVLKFIDDNPNFEVFHNLIGKAGF